MKISCLTFHDSSNYGSVLQSYALQTVLEGMGNEYQIINYSNKEKRKYDSLFRKNKEQSVVRYLGKLIDSPYNIIKRYKFRLFSNRYLNQTERIKTFRELQVYGSDKDVLIVGSDQVWNTDMIRKDPAYFLKFADGYKSVAYAASIGKSVLREDEKEFICRMIKDFNYISVREKTAAELIEQITGRRAKIVLDPSLLLDRNAWAKICVRKKKHPYIFAYVLTDTPSVQDFIKSLIKATNLHLYYVSAHFISARNKRYTSIPSPQEWITLMMNAEYVVTTSFHGTAFAVNFKKNFFTFINGRSQDSQNSRQVDFLKSVGLEERINPVFSVELLKQTLDFTQSENYLIEKRGEAKKFIKKAVEDVGDFQR